MGAYFELPRHTVLKQSIGKRRNGLKSMAVRHARERAQKEQELAAVEAELEAYLRDNPEITR
ncbi:hypothetical protein IU11_13950 [Cellulosimicrobium sp. MM]|nr:hypothetical protein [Cellulosimicrobium sp. MM]KFD43144.1 hypothetical protein IU11_13950 [Cellulosimicrobium sp. MM]